MGGRVGSWSGNAGSGSASAGEDRATEPRHETLATAADWVSRYERHLRQAGDHAARALALHRDVMGHVARGDLPPTILEDRFPEFAQERGAAYVDALSDLSLRYLTGWVDVLSRWSCELMGAVPRPRVRGVAEPSPVGGPVGLERRFGQLLAYAEREATDIAAAYRSFLDRVATGGPAVAPLAPTDPSPSRLAGRLGTLVALHCDLLDGSSEVNARFGEEYLTGVLARFAPRQRPRSLDLTAPLGGTASATLTLANTTDARSVLRCSVPDVRRSDGIGPAFSPRATITPAEVDLRPGEETRLVLSVELVEPEYEPWVPYVGTLQGVGVGETRLDVPLRITATSSAPDGASARTRPRGGE